MLQRRKMVTWMFMLKRSLDLILIVSKPSQFQVFNVGFWLSLDN